MQRRSTTRNVPRKRYTTDAFDGIEELQDVDPDGNDDAHAHLYDDDDEGDSGDEFNVAEDHPENEDDEESSDDGDFDLEDHPNSTGNRGVRSLHPEMSDTDDLYDENASSQVFESRTTQAEARVMKRNEQRAHLTYTRGLPEVSNRLHHMARQNRWLLYFGPSKYDYEPVFKARTTFVAPTLPSREIDSEGHGGFHSSFYIPCGRAQSDAERDLELISNGKIREKLNELQISEMLSDVNVPQQFRIKERHMYRDVLLGPYGQQQKHQLAANESLSLAKAWRIDACGDPEISSRNGFLLNIGKRVHCLKWAPNQNHDKQYLAISTLPRRHCWNLESDAIHAPAFVPQEPCPSAIQVWQFHVGYDGRIDSETSPHLALNIHTDWGDPRQLKWFSTPYQPQDTSTSRSLGLLAGIWADGMIRLLDIPLPELDQSETIHLRIVNAAFSVKAPNTVFTCLAWIDGRRIAAGCANGCIAVWDLELCLSQPSSDNRPQIYTSVSTSYVLSIASCTPSRPEMLLVSTAAGFIIMVDISKTGQPLLSHTSCALSGRIRVIQPPLLWSEFAQAALYVDDNFNLRGSSIRRMFTSIGLGRYHSHVVCLAGSPVHPYILAATVGGQVVSLNPMKRYLNAKSPVFQQTWFAHEWRPPLGAKESARSDGRHSQIGAGGLSRMLEGHKVERVTMATDIRQSSHGPEGGKYAAIYEEKTAVTAIAWNPNLHVGGWAAAACADGIVRVEDIAI